MGATLPPKHVILAHVPALHQLAQLMRLRTRGGDTVPYLRPIHWIVLPSQSLITRDRISEERRV
jgi:hypothetical protein